MMIECGEGVTDQSVGLHMNAVEMQSVCVYYTVCVL